MTELPFQLLYCLTASDDDWIATTLDVDSVATSQRLLLDKGISLACLETRELPFTPTIVSSLILSLIYPIYSKPNPQLSVQNEFMEPFIIVPNILLMLDKKLIGR